MVLNKDFREFIELLNVHEIKYLVVGGYAVTIHGYPRFTDDIDIWFWIEESNALSMIEVLKDFGFSSLKISVSDLISPNKIIQLGYPPNRIDLLTSVDGLEFEKCYPDKVVFEIDGLKVNFIDLENLKKNKKASGRYKDLNDLENLQ